MIGGNSLVHYFDYVFLFLGFVFAVFFGVSEKRHGNSSCIVPIVVINPFVSFF